MDPRDQLYSLLTAGMLQIITAEPDPDRPTDDPADPRYYVAHTVTELEEREDSPVMRARTAEGDWCAGQPAALLRRLMERAMAGG